MFQKTSSFNLPISLSTPIPVLIFIGLSFLSFSIPFSLGHPQWLVGTIVNACLFLTAVFLPKKFIFPLVVLPSLGVLFRGIIFGPLTMFLIYFMPFIWLANLVLILTFKKFFSYLNYSFCILFASIIKFLFLFVVANIYFKLSIVPQIFIQLMGVSQLMTALAGGVISLIIFSFIQNTINKTEKEGKELGSNFIQNRLQ